MARSSMGAEFRGLCGRGRPRWDLCLLIITYTPLLSGIYHYECICSMHYGGMLPSSYTAGCLPQIGERREKENYQSQSHGSIYL